MAFRNFLPISSCRSRELMPRVIRFAGGINIGENDLIRQGQRVCKIRKEGFCPGIGMGLEYAPEGFMGIIHSSLESCCNFCGMMRIIIYYGGCRPGCPLYSKRRSVPVKFFRAREAVPMSSCR